MKEKLKNKKGITLVALVITVIIMLILAGVAISVVVDGEGLFSRTRQAAEEYEQAAQNENTQLQSLMDEIDNYLAGGTDYSGANKPELLTGMSAIKFNRDGTTRKISQENSAWYNYSQKQWANAETKDGSLWVWIPRFAYKITYNDINDKSLGGTIDVVFLEGTSNNYTYVKGDGTTEIRTASATLDTSTYTLHPSFKKAVNEDYSHGEWDEELTGYWVAKFEAGWQQGDAVNTSSNNKENAVESSLEFKNVYEKRYLSNKSKITYPVFKGQTYSMNYISVADAFAISRCMTEKIEGQDNFYGLSDTDTDSHLMKNSEWGACAYLGYSQFGTNGQGIYKNNANLNNTVNGIYAVTGYSGSILDETHTSDLSILNAWYTIDGQKASCTYNITGVYDMSGGTWEKVAALVLNDNENIQKYGTVDIEDKLVPESNLSTKYSTLYKNGDDSGAGNYSENLNVYGDAIVETSKEGIGNSSWNQNSSYFVDFTYPSFIRGGRYLIDVVCGSFNFHHSDGAGYLSHGFRTVLCKK